MRSKARRATRKAKGESIENEEERKHKHVREVETQKCTPKQGILGYLRRRSVDGRLPCGIFRGFEAEEDLFL